MSGKKVEMSIKNVRTSFPCVNKVDAWGNYTMHILLSKTDKEDQNILDIVKLNINKIIKQEGLNAKKITKDNIFIKDGDGDKLSQYDGYSGHWVLKLKNNPAYPPRLFDNDDKPLSPEGNQIVSGCFVDVLITLWASRSNGTQWVGANMSLVRFNSEGEPFGRKERDDEELLSTFYNDGQDKDDAKEDEESDKQEISFL